MIAATLRRFSTSVLISIRAPHSVTRLRFQIKSRRRAPTRNMSGNPVSIQHQGYARLLSENTLQGTGTHRTSGRQAQTLQAYRTSMREDGAELRLVRRACSRLHLDQIRPHGLEKSSCARRRRQSRKFHSIAIDCETQKRGPNELTAGRCVSVRHGKAICNLQSPCGRSQKASGLPNRRAKFPFLVQQLLSNPSQQQIPENWVL